MNKEQLIGFFRHKFPYNIVNAFDRIPRENFVLDNFKSLSYEDVALPIDENQTISQPSTIALMLSLLKTREEQKVLEIGSGCGYVLALLSKLVGERGNVFGIEVVKELAERSKKNLSNLNLNNVEVFNINGKHGLPEKSPFNRILISAAIDEVPREILNQLKENGIIVAPIGPRSIQTLTSIKRIGNDFVIVKEIPGFVFVPFED